MPFTSYLFSIGAIALHSEEDIMAGNTISHHKVFRKDRGSSAGGRRGSHRADLGATTENLCIIRASVFCVVLAGGPYPGLGFTGL